jgi:hypothetical protein
MAPRFAAFELVRAAALTTRSAAQNAAAQGLAAALAQLEIVSTAPAALLDGVTADSSFSVRSRFLGFRPPVIADASPNLLEWHFSLTSTGDAGLGARATYAQQVFILAPAPIDPAACRASGCPVPPICGEADGCEPALRVPAQPVSWHLPEEDT